MEKIKDLLNRIRDYWKNLPDETKEKVFRYGCLITGIACYPLMVWWVLGIICAVISLVLGFVHAGKWKLCKTTAAGMILSGLMLLILLLFLIAAQVYISFLNIKV